MVDRENIGGKGANSSIKFHNQILTMDKSVHLNPTVEKHTVTRATGRAVPELLEDAGNCRQSANQERRLHFLSDSLFSEQQKLRHVLDWAENVLHSRSEVCSQICRADSLILADLTHRGSERMPPECKHLSTDKYHQPVSCAAGDSEVFGGLLNFGNGEQYTYPCMYKPPLCLSENRECGNRKSLYPQHATSKQTQSQDNWEPNGLHSQKHQTDTSNSSTNQTLSPDTTTGLIKASASLFKLPHDGTDFLSTISPESKGEYQEAQRAGPEESDKSRREERCRAKEQESSLEMTKTTTPILTAHFTLPSDLTVYEQYQLCVHHFQISQPVKSGCVERSPEKQQKTSEDSCPITKNETDRHLNTGGQKVTAAETAEERRSLVIRKKQDRSNAPYLDLSEEAFNTPTDNLKTDDVSPAEKSAANPGI